MSTFLGTYRRGRVAALCVGLLASSFLTVQLTEPAAAAPPTLSAVRIIGGPGHAGHYGWGADTIPPGQPRAGNVLITDYWNFRVSEFDQQGNLVGHRITDDGNHFAPYDVAVNPVNGNIAIGDVDNAMRVDIYSSTGQFLRACGNGQRWRYPAWLDYDATGRLAVADSRGHKIVVINDATCAVTLQFGTQGGSLSQFNTPRGVDFAPDGTLWVADENNGRLVQWRVNATSATALKSIPAPGADRRGLLYNSGDNLLYLVNAGASTVDVYNPTSGARVRSFGGFGTGIGQFVDGGRGITRDGSGNIWVGDMPGFRSQKFSPAGQFLLSAPNPVVPPPLGGYNQPGNVAVMADNTVVGIDSFNWRVNVHNADGTPRSAFGTRTTFNYPRGIASDRSENTVVIANTDAGAVDKYTLAGTRTWRASGVKAWAVAVDQVDGRIYAAEFINNRVRVINRNGSLGATFGTGQLTNPRGIAVDPVDRSVWVSSLGTNRITHFSSTGALLGSFATGAGAAFDVEVDVDTVYLADQRGQVIRMFSKAGVSRGSFGGGGSGLGRFLGPVGLEIKGTSLYVMETTNERIQELRINR